MIASAMWAGQGDHRIRLHGLLPSGNMYSTGWIEFKKNRNCSADPEKDLDSETRRLSPV
jgi:hypothetical protein